MNTTLNKPQSQIAAPGDGANRINYLTPLANISETADGYILEAEMPGVNKDDIHVTLEGNTLSVSAETKRASEQKEGDKVLHSERYFGKVYRSFTLGQEVDEANARARFENGVLELTLPKKAVTAARKLAIE